MEMKAIREVSFESNPRFVKFTIPWNAAQKSKEWVSVATFPIPHEAKSRSRKNGNMSRWFKSKCHRNHITVMTRTYCHVGNCLSSYCKNPLQPYSSNNPYVNANKHNTPMFNPPIMPNTRHGTAIVTMDFQVEMPVMVYSVWRLKTAIVISAPMIGPRPVDSGNT